MVKPTSTQFPIFIQSLYPDEQHALAFYIKCVSLVGLLMRSTSLLKETNPVWAKLMTRLVCLMVYVICKCRYSAIRKITRQRLLNSTSSNVLFGWSSKEVLNVYLGVCNVFPTCFHFWNHCYLYPVTPNIIRFIC